MRVAFHPTLLGISLLVGLRAAAAFGATLYVAPHGAGEACTRDSPCALGSGATRAVAGDTVILMDGIYREPLHPENSGTPEAWITFRADDCALPVLEGPGESFDQDSEADGPSGVASTTGTYLRFEGIVSRYWDSGFTNGWTGQGTTDSNGHIEYVNCIGDGNWRTGLVMYSAGGITIRECIAAHNGGSPSRSWSSGIQLYAVQGTADENVVERSVSFENTDAQKRNDGSGFIVDEYTQGATFLNNIGFRNGGSCMRLTRSGNTRMVNFSCYHNAMNPHPNSPGDPGEFYFTDDVSREGSVVTNALAAASGTPADRAVMLHAPATGVTNNVIVNEGAAPFFSDPEGEHPDFRPPVSAAGDVEDQGTVQNAPQVDIGFDPQCIVKRDPGVPFQQSWWQYAIDYDYVRSIGGVARCFHPKPRTGGVDVGAYELSGEPHQFSPPGSCVPGTSGPSGDGAGGAAAANGTPGDDTGAAASPTPATPEHSDGCSCRVAGSRIAASPGLLALVAATALACARRRRRASVLCP